MLAKKNTNQYSQSINIVRDADRELIYYPTDNAKRIYQQIINDYKTGSRVFNIIGSYGTGKSAFLWALEQNMVKGKPYFLDGNFTENKIEVIRIVGEYVAVKDAVANACDLDFSVSSSEIFAKIFYDHRSAISSGLLLILIDEFGKFLEFAAKNNPEKELYFLQEFAEFVNNPAHNIILITTVHQNFDAYAFGLESAQRMEWGKVKGRFKEITFNEPIEQILRLAADYLKFHGQKNDANDEVRAMELAQIINRSAVFEISREFLSDIALDLLPLDVLAANVLTISLQKYGQNERSLFSFLEASDHTSLKVITRTNVFFNLAHVYDYLLFNFYAYIQSKYNPDYSVWIAIRNALDEVQRRIDERVEDCIKIIKTVGLLQLSAVNGSRLDDEFLESYVKLCMHIENPNTLIKKLKLNKIIIYREHLQRYVLNEGTSLDVEAALILAATKVEQVNDVSTLLKRYYAMAPVLAKSYTYETGTPRLFDFIITDSLKYKKAEGDTDGNIYLIFNEKLTLDDVKNYSVVNAGEPAIYVLYENSKSIKDLLFELEKLRKVKEENSGDTVAVKLLDESLEAGQKALNYFILGSLHSGANNIKWVWNGLEQRVSNKRSFNQLLSIVCSTAYPATPIFNNELLNKHKISPSIATARKNYFKALVNNWSKVDLGFDKEKFPPEKTIFLSLIKENRISISTGTIDLQDDKNKIGQLWDASLLFLYGTKERRTNVSELVEILSNKPFKLKQGLITFWLPSFLFAKRDEFALFGENGYVPFITEETLDLIIRYPEKYQIKAFDIDGIKLDFFNSYRIFLQQETKEGVDNLSFIETIRPFLTFYRQLPEFVKKTKVNLSKEAIAIRNIISNTEDLEKTFFEDFPTALGYNTSSFTGDDDNIQRYILQLESTIKEIRSCFELLVARFEIHIQDRIIGEQVGFEQYKKALSERYSNINAYLINAEQKSFVQRLSSNIDDRKAWLNSVAQSLVGKPFEIFNDTDEFLLKDRFTTIIADLDNLSNLATADYDGQIDDVLGFEINSFIDGVNKTIVRLPKSKRTDIAKIEDKIKNVIEIEAGNNQLNIVALANVIKKLMES